MTADNEVSSHRTRSNVTYFTFACYICGEQFADEQGLAEHLGDDATR